MESQHLALQETAQSKCLPTCTDTEAGVPAPIRLRHWRWLLASCTVTAGLVFAVGLAVMQPQALPQHRLWRTTVLEEAVAKESITSAEKEIKNDIHVIEVDMKKFLTSRIEKDIDRDIKAKLKKDGGRQQQAMALAKVDKDFEAEVNQDVATDVGKHVEKTFGHDIKKDLESHLASFISEGAQAVEKKDDDEGNNSKPVAATRGCCTWRGKCAFSQALCNINEGRCKDCGGRWKPNTTPRDFGGLDNAWCSASKMDTWALPSVPTYEPVSHRPVTVKILDWNLAWYEVYKKRGGEGGQQGKWLASSGPYDIIGFQECQNPWQLLTDGALKDTYHTYQGGKAKDSKAVCILYKKDTWEELGHGEKKVAEDQPGKSTYLGKRIAVWFRLRHKETNENVTFVNHHGPLPLGSGGICGGHATAYNILEVIQNNSKAGDAIVLVGDFNAAADSLTMNQLTSSLTRCYSGIKFNGIDHFITNFNVKRVVHTANLGGHGSDHDALSITFKLGLM